MLASFSCAAQLYVLINQNVRVSRVERLDDLIVIWNLNLSLLSVTATIHKRGILLRVFLFTIFVVIQVLFSRISLNYV